MEFIVNKDVVDLGVTIRGVQITNVNNHIYSNELKDYINEHLQTLLNKETIETINDDIIKGFYDLHKKVNIPKKKNPPASENLLKTLVKKQSAYSINPVVDIYNLISMESRLALGAHDIEHINGNMNLRLTNGTENFIPLGQNEPKAVKEGVYSYIDDSNDILCYLEIRQVDKTKITEDSQDIFYIVQGNENTTQEYVDKIASELIDVTTHFLGGEGKLLSSGRD
jgi:DNA/RNA-binding domain of Phe-tRNA-synthetase-like protein